MCIANFNTIRVMLVDYIMMLKKKKIHVPCKFLLCQENV